MTTEFMKKQLLLTPGPLTTSDDVKKTMLNDWGSRDEVFIKMTQDVRKKILQISELGDTYTVVPIQGSGTFSVEAMIGTIIPQEGKILVLINGSYGERIAKICQIAGKNFDILQWAENEPVDPDALGRHLEKHPGFSHIVVVHVETTTGMLNPINEIAAVAKQYDIDLLLDSMSAFGMMPIDNSYDNVVAVAASSNKCIEGVPGIGFVLVKEDVLRKSVGNSHSLSLDLHGQFVGFEKNGQWRFTPPVQVVAALNEALMDSEFDDGIEKRRARYSENCKILRQGMEKLGFTPYLPDSLQAPIIVTFLMPQGFKFNIFYEKLKSFGFTIYPGKLTKTDSFRVGCIGQVYKKDILNFLDSVSKIL